MGLSSINQPFLALHGTDSLLRADLSPNAGGSLIAAMTAGADAGVDLTFAPGAGLGVRYNLASVASEIVSLPAFAQNDLVSIALGGQNPTTVTLRPDSTYPGDGGACYRALVQVQAGQIDMTSTFAASGAVRVVPPQCLMQVACGESDTQDWLAALSSAACY